MIVSKTTQQLLIPYDSKVRALWPNVPTIEHGGKQLAIIPHNTRSQTQLRAAGIDAPAPILFYYDWNQGKPFQVQKNTAALITSHTRSFVLNDMGTGKTRAALWSWRYLNKAGMAKKLLVVAPLSTLKFVWLREILVTLPDVRAVVLHGSREKRRELLAQDYDVYIINHDGTKVVAPELYARADIDTLIIDELAVYRNPSQRSRMMRDFAQKFVWVTGMTGRPMPNAVTDVWSQAKIIAPQRVPRFFRHARSMLMTQISPYKWVPQPGATEKALSWMQPNVRYSLDDVVELPDAISRVIDIELSAEQKTIYRRLANEMAAMVKEQKITAANAGVALGKLLQVGAGYVYSENPLHVVLDSNSRQQMLLEILDEAEHKVIVFAPWRHLIEGLSGLLTKNEIDHAVIHGNISKRELIFGDFQNTERYRVLLAHPQCLHHGVTLTAATTILWYSPVTSLEVYEQANARIRRVGQKHKQLFLHFQATPVERKVYAMLRNKQKTQDEFLQMIKTATANGEM